LQVGSIINFAAVYLLAPVPAAPGGAAALSLASKVGAKVLQSAAWYKLQQINAIASLETCSRVVPSQWLQLATAFARAGMVEQAWVFKLCAVCPRLPCPPAPHFSPSLCQVFGDYYLNAWGAPRES